MREDTIVKRRSYLKYGSTLGAIGLAGCLGGVGGGSGSGTVKIGALTALSGSLSLYGQENRRGYTFASSQLDGEILGNEIEIIYEDTQGQPEVGLSKFRELVDQENVDAVIGPVVDPVNLAIRPELENNAQIPYIVSQTSAPIARANPENCNRFWFFTWPSFHDFFSTITQFITEELNDTLDEPVDTQSVTFVQWDNNAGAGAFAAFEQAFTDAGGEITDTITIPPGEQDMASYISSVENSEDRLIIGFLPGSDGIRFVQQSANYGLKEEKVFCFQADTTNNVALPAEGEAANGWFGTTHYQPSRESDLNNQFKDWYRSNHDDLPPNVLASNGFNQLYSLAQGMEQAGSTAPDDVISALEGLSFPSPQGELTYRPADHQIEQNFASYQVVNQEHDIISEYQDVIAPAQCDVTSS